MARNIICEIIIKNSMEAVQKIENRTTESPNNPSSEH
jgi:hypothetical protein